MRSCSRYRRAFSWLLLLVAILGSSHSVVDQVLESCPVARTAVLEHGDDHEHDSRKDLESCLPDAGHEICLVIGASADFRQASSKSDPQSPSFACDSFGASWAPLAGKVVRDARIKSSRPPSSSAFHQRVGLRLYA